ncbi:sensor histidine kinase [Paenibacillus vulneris]|uniref:Sensor histidine kinase n=1 Tax=Paenibacillus vulneris TaxID=1133364 RepID=A0ABW3UHI5_9BACL
MLRLFLNNVKLRNKLLLMYFFSVFIPIVLTNVIFYYVTTNNVKNQKTRDAVTAMEQTKSEIRNFIDEAVGITYLFYTDTVFNQMLDEDYSSNSEYIEAYQSYIRPSFYRVWQANKSVKEVQLFVDNPTILTSSNIDHISQELQKTDWYITLFQTKVPYPLVYKSGNTLSLLQRLDNYAYYSNYLKLLKVELNMQTMQELLQHSAFEGKLYLVDPQGRIAYSNDGSVDWANSNISMASLSFPDQRVLTFRSDYQNINYLNGWSLRGVMNEVSMLEEVRKSGSFVIILACLNFLVPSIILVFIARSLHVRLIRILKHMKKVKNQNFETIPDEESRDEIGQLIGEFNRMTLQIQSLIEDVYIADIQKKNSELKQRQAQLHALHSQINPHFLFNALETIRMRSLMKSEKETARIIQNMAKMLRRSIAWGRDWVTVREEMELALCFLEIQKYRFGDRLEYRLNVQEEAYGSLIPKMSFLPFIENASIHGVEKSPESGLICIDLYLEEEVLVFRLSDNGMGIPKEKYAELMEYLHEKDSFGEHVGIKNVYTRLQMCYGDSFDFRLQSEENFGTIVEIRLPSGDPGT